MDHTIHTAHTNLKEEVIRDGDLLFEVRRRIWLIALCRFLQWAIFTIFFLYHLHHVSIISAFFSWYGLLMLVIVISLEFLIRNEINYSFLLAKDKFIWFPTKKLKETSKRDDINNISISIRDITIGGNNGKCILKLSDGKKYPWGNRKITICKDFSENSIDVFEKIDKMKYQLENSKIKDNQRNSKAFITKRYYLRTILNADKFDKSLSDGWFRMQQDFFTTQFVLINQQFQSAIWLRYNLRHLSFSLKRLTLYRWSKKFHYEVVSFKMNETFQKLYLRHQESYSDQIYPTLQALLYGNAKLDRFNTYVLNIYDETKLIGANIFDVGNSSAAGVVSFCDPEYGNYSLIELMAYRVIDYCAEKGMSFYYAGYFIPNILGYPYKPKVYNKAIEYFRISTNSWRSIGSFVKTDIPLEEINVSLNDLKEVLIQIDFNALVVTNTAFQSSDFLENYPVFLLCSTSEEFNCDRAITYNCIDKKYYCYHVPQSKIRLNLIGECFSCDIVFEFFQLIAATSQIDELIEIMTAIKHDN